MLDDIKTYEAFDPGELNFSIERLPEAMMRAWEVVQEVKKGVLPKKIESVLICADTRTALVSRAFLSALQAEISVPVVVLTEGELPKFARTNTLVVAFDIEDSLFVSTIVRQARAKKLKVLCAGLSSKFAALAKKEGCTYFSFDSEDDMHRQRVHGGFFAGILLGVLQVASVCKIGKGRVRNAVNAMIEVIDSSDITVKSEENPAKIVANALHGERSLLLAEGHLVSTRALIQFWLAVFADESIAPSASVLKEAPDAARSSSRIFALRSHLYDKTLKKRLSDVVDGLEEAGAEVIDYEARGKTPLDEVAELLQFGYFLAYYSALLNKVTIS